VTLGRAANAARNLGPAGISANAATAANTGSSASDGSALVTP